MKNLKINNNALVLNFGVGKYTVTEDQIKMDKKVLAFTPGSDVEEFFHQQVNEFTFSTINGGPYNIMRRHYILDDFDLIDFRLGSLEMTVVFRNGQILGSYGKDYYGWGLVANDQKVYVAENFRDITGKYLLPDSLNGEYGLCPTKQDKENMFRLRRLNAEKVTITNVDAGVATFVTKRGKTVYCLDGYILGYKAEDVEDPSVYPQVEVIQSSSKIQ